MLLLQGFLFKRRKKLTELSCVRFSEAEGKLPKPGYLHPQGASYPGHGILPPNSSCLEKNG